MNSTGNTVLITGGSSGIGLALAKRLIASGNEVVVCGRDRGRLDAAQAELPGLMAIQADVADPASRVALVAQVQSRFPNLNVLVNNAGLLHVCDMTAPLHVGQLADEIAVNLMAPVHLISVLLPAMRRHPSCTVANVSSGYVFLPSARTPLYSATKTALHVYTRGLRYQFAGSGIQVTEVMPPATDTAMASHYTGAKMAPEQVARHIVDGLVDGRDEIVIGVSRWAKLLARAAPETAFKLLNRAESAS